MDVNNKIVKTGLPEQPLNSPEDLKKATRKEIINIFDEDNNGIITQKEQKNVISRYLPKEYQNYDESIIEQSMKTWIYKDLNINAEEDQLGIDALKGKINVIKDDIVHNSSSSKQKQVFGLADNLYNRSETKVEEETLSSLADTNNNNIVSNKEMVDFIFDTIMKEVDDYPNLTTDDVYNVIKYCVENFRLENFDKAYSSTTDDEIGVLHKFAKQRLNEYNNTKDTPPPSILNKEGGPGSEKCMEYIMRQIMARGLKLDEDKVIEAIMLYNFDFSGDDSMITVEEIERFGEFYSKFMNSSEGKLADTHALDFIVNRYESL